MIVVHGASIASKLALKLVWMKSNDEFGGMFC